jgi:alpha-ketoglutarate-dependent taurine dioxygenase
MVFASPRQLSGLGESGAFAIGQLCPAEGSMIGKASEIGVAGLKCTPAELEITWQNSSYSVYSSAWLRDNDPVNRDPVTGQRLVSVLDLPALPQLQAAEPQPAGHITLTWDDGRTTVFPVSWLRAFDRSLRISPRPHRQPWMGQPAEAFAWCDYSEWMTNPASREDWLYYAGRDGLAFLRDVPADPGEAKTALFRIAAAVSIGGQIDDSRFFEIRSVSETSNNGYKTPAPRVYTDRPYRDPAPGFQLLHCLSAAGHGGEIVFVDGMAVAERLRAHDRDAFTTLSQIPVLFRFEELGLTMERTMLDIDTRGEFRAIYYDDRSIAPIPLKGPRLKKYYPAYRELAELLREPARLVGCRLQPGDLVLFDNARILHGNAALSAGARHFQGFHLDAEGLYSALALLSRRERN